MNQPEPLFVFGGQLMNPLTTGIVISFWVCTGAVFFAYAGYPLLLWYLSRWFGRQVPAPTGPEAADEDLPSLSVLIAAYNEESVIENRIRNALALDYPPDKLEIVVASDGSADATPAIVERYSGRGVRLLHNPQRRGKAATLNSAFAELTGEIVLLSDANTHTDPDAARKLVRWFQDSRVGAVCGRLVLTDPQTGKNADSLYWKYETFLKRCEGRLGALLGSNGAIYAIRKQLFTPIPADTLVDDLVIPLQAKLQTGCAIVYECAAIAREETAPDVRSEFHRRSRIGAGGFQSIALLWRLLDPRRGWIAFTFFFHKILRWLCPFFMLGMLVSNCSLLLLSVEEPLYRWALAAQVSFYLVSLLAVFVPAQFRSLKPLRLTTMFTSMNLALLVGFFRWLRGNHHGVWRRTARLAEYAAR
jgi:cellulose synthase/poly-beta-1,6-N-acetylglucosamine synthase-like glycosyltransferase